MNILVTGGAGFIGSNFILYWLEKHPDDTIKNIDTLTYAGNLENLKDAKGKSQYSFIRGNICDANAVDEAMEGVDAVFHFAAETHVDRSIRGPLVFLQTNAVGTQVLLESALRHGVKHFHHVSTDEVFGSLSLEGDDAFHEGYQYRPTSPYSASKAASDHLVNAYHSTYGLKTTITNCSNNYGPRQFPEKLLPLAITNVLEGKKIPVYGDGKNVRDWLYVNDHCRAIDLVFQKGRAGETYCIGGTKKEINNLELVKKVLRIMGKDEECIEFVTDRPGHDRRYAVNWTKAHTEIGYSPECTIDEYLERTVDWYRNNESWWKKIKSGEYKKYYQEQYGKAV